MAEAIKKFFQKKKLDTKFKLAGTGHRLNESAPQHASVSHGSTSVQSSHPAQKSQAAQIAGAAALQRFESNQKPKDTRSAQAIKAQAKRELEVESRMSKVDLPSRSESASSQAHDGMAVPVHGVYFTCSLLGDDLVLPRDQLLSRLAEFLLGEPYAEDPLFISCTMVKTFGRTRAVCDQCIEVLEKYVQNIIQHPDDEKYRKIRLSNKVFQEKVAPVLGAVEFLRAIGFEMKSGEDGEMLSIDSSKCSEATLTAAILALKSAERISLILCRDPVVFKPGIKSTSVPQMSQLPAVFFTRTLEEIKKEQEDKARDVDRLTTLRTREMRERDEAKQTHLYRYTIIRTCFPDGYVLQGTFKSTERLADVEEFISSFIANDFVPFALFDPQGCCLKPGEVQVEEEHAGDQPKTRHKTLAELGLVPAVLIRFQWDPEVAKDVDPKILQVCLKEEVIAKARNE